MYKCNHMTFWKRKNYGGGKKISVCQGLEWGRKGGAKRQRMGTALGSETLLGDTRVVDT